MKNTDSPSSAHLLSRLMRLTFGFLAVIIVLIVFGRLTILDGLIIVITGWVIAYFLLREEEHHLSALKIYFTKKAARNNPAFFTEAKEQKLLTQNSDTTSINELVWAISNAEEKALSLYQKLQQTNAYQQQILVNLPLPMIILDEQSRVSEFNKQADSLFSHLEAGRHIALIIQNNAIIEQIQQVQNNQLPSVETELVLDLDIQRHFTLLVASFSADKQTRTAITLLDRTTAIQTEKMRSDFVANVSHELRTPLTALVGFIETLQGPAGADAKTRGKFLNILKEQAHRMKRLATDQLSLAQIERNERQRPDELCNLDAICERVIDLLKEMASKADITIEFKPDKQPLFILGHHDELGQMVQNIVENAIRYGRAGGHVLISLHHRAVPPEHEDDHYCSIAISDDGEGIDKEHIPRLTERFYRVDKDRSRAKGGTGLGLAIVKHIVHHHRGILDIQSQPKKGSVFTIYFPLPDQQENKRPERTTLS